MSDKPIKLAITASAGTGKTTRIIALYEEALKAGFPAFRVAATSYTNRASAEIRQRLLAERPAATGLDDAPIGTLHSLFYRAIQVAPFQAGVDPDFFVVGPQFAAALFLEALRTEALLSGLELTPEIEARLSTLFQKRVLAPAFLAASAVEEPLVALYARAERRYRQRLGADRLAPSDLERVAFHLAHDPRAKRRVQSRIPRLLVDEAQDTSPMQHQTIRQLFEGAIVVGDPKQAIYRFREADPDAFQALLDDAERVEVLDQTYRHGPHLARFLNAFVARHAGRAWPPIAAQPVRPNPERQDAPPTVLIVEADGEAKVEQARQVEARLVAEEIARLHAEGVPYSEIAVLVRTRHNARALFGALERQGVPYVAPSTTPLYHRAPVQDLLSLLHVLAGEPDVFHYAVVLTAPGWGRGRLADLERLDPEDPEASLRRHFPELYAWIQGIRDRLAEGPAAALYAALEKPAPGHEHAFLAHLDPADLDAVLYTLAQIERARDFAEAATILEQLRSHADEAADLGQTRGDAVEILTIHAAKGLQRRAVFVFDAGRTLTHKLRTDPPDLLVDPRSGRVITRENPEFAAHLKAHIEAELKELTRLFYVALSRAQAQLWVTGSVNPGWKLPEDTFLHMLGQLQNEDPTFVPDPALAPHLRVRRVRVSEVAKAPPAAERRPAAFAPPLAHPAWLQAIKPPPPAVQSPSAVRKERAEDPGLRLAAADPELALEARHYALTVGTLVHAGIERGWDPDDPGFLETLRAERIFLALDAEDRERAAREIAALLRSYREMLERGQIAPLGDQDHRELPFAYRDDDGQVWEGVIDRLVQVPDGTWWIEDFKTDHEVHPEHYALQMGVYKAAARAFLGVEPRARLVYLRHRRAIEV